MIFANEMCEEKILYSLRVCTWNIMTKLKLTRPQCDIWHYILKLRAQNCEGSHGFEQQARYCGWKEENSNSILNWLPLETHNPWYQYLKQGKNIKKQELTEKQFEIPALSCTASKLWSSETFGFKDLKRLLWSG